jgi:hypothetical protein
MQIAGRNISATSITLVLVLITSLSVLFSILRSNERRRKQQQAVEAASKQFPYSFDSVYAKNDTVSFFKNDTFVGMSVTMTD